MNTEQRQQLVQAQAALKQMQAVSADERELLISMLADITRLLGQPGEDDSANQSLIDRLDELAVHFEAEHPSLGAALRRVVDALGKAGI
ncbi:MAG TPA: DUF4404 family protein [Steroidobacteraceae bacterium]|nr:DUF4404 family protein [Steroidobacteraceae bacterium]